MMLDTGFLNSNLIRSFPFIYNPSATVPNWLVVDFRAIVTFGWDPTAHRIFLAWVTRYGDRLRFGFRTDSPAMADQELVFERSLADPRYKTDFVESTPLAQTLEERCGCSIELLCDPDLDGDNPICGPELLCNAELSVECDVELLCTAGPECAIVDVDDVGTGVIC